MYDPFLQIYIEDYVASWDFFKALVLGEEGGTLPIEGFKMTCEYLHIPYHQLSYNCLPQSREYPLLEGNVQFVNYLTNVST